jgi:excisionase family DNA binding protein
MEIYGPDELAARRGVRDGAVGADVVEPVLLLSELAARLGVSAQTLYDLRSQGRGPTGFRVGRQLRFRRSEIEAWLTRLEDDDAVRHGAERLGPRRLGSVRHGGVRR